MDTRKRNKIWALRQEGTAPDAAVINAFAAEIGLSPICARLLWSRGLTDAASVKRFLACEDTMFHSPFLLRDIEPAVARIRRAIDDHEKIVISATTTLTV